MVALNTGAPEKRTNRMEMSRLFQITTYKQFFLLFINILSKSHNLDEINSLLNVFRFLKVWGLTLTVRN